MILLSKCYCSMGGAEPKLDLTKGILGLLLARFCALSMSADVRLCCKTFLSTGSGKCHVMLINEVLATFMTQQPILTEQAAMEPQEGKRCSCSERLIVFRCLRLNHRKPILDDIYPHMLCSEESNMLDISSRINLFIPVIDLAFCCWNVPVPCSFFQSQRID